MTTLSNAVSFCVLEARIIPLFISKTPWIDPFIRAAMDSGDDSIPGSELQEQAYDALNTFFKVHEDEVVEIEILPPAIQPTDGLVMKDGLNVGVPKKVLVLAYVEAKRRFFKSIDNEMDTSVSTVHYS